MSSYIITAINKKHFHKKADKKYMNTAIYANGDKMQKQDKIIMRVCAYLQQNACTYTTGNK